VFFEFFKIVKSQDKNIHAEYNGTFTAVTSTR